MERFLTMGVLFFISLVATTNLSGQEYTKYIYDDNTHDPIIKEYGAKRVLGVNKDSRCRFYLYGDDSTYANYKEIEIAHINDFKVVGDYVFFCGYNYEHNSKVAVMGYFNLLNFASSVVSYLPVISFSEFEKIAPCKYNPNSMKHMIIAVDNNGYEYMVEVQFTTYGVMYPTWFVRSAMLYDFYGDELIFDDIAITDTFYVVTARPKPMLYYDNIDSIDNADVTRLQNIGYILYFKRVTSFPTSSLSHYDISVLPYQHVYYPILIEKCVNNYFVTATVSDIYRPNRIFIDAFDGLSQMHSISFAPNFDYTTLECMSFNNYSNELEVVVKDMYDGHSIDNKTRIYTFNQLMTVFPIPATAHVFDGYNIKSLCYLNNTNDNFIASGYCLGDNSGNPYIFKYHYFIWNDCTSDDTISIKFENPEINTKTPSLNYNEELHDIEIAPHTSDIVPIIIKCPKRDEE